MARSNKKLKGIREARAKAAAEEEKAKNNISNTLFRMGASASVESHLSTRDIYRYSAVGLSVAEIEYAFRRFTALKAYNENLTSVKPHELDGCPHPAGPEGSLNLSYGTVHANPALTISGGVPIFSEQLRLDWLLARAIKKWKDMGVRQKMEFLFNVLDYNKDGLITTSDLSILIHHASPHKVKVGDRVQIKTDSRTGILRFMGETKFAPGSWAGLELDQNLGKHDGMVQGVRYFTCEPGHGVFVQSMLIELIEHRNAAAEIIDTLSSDKGSLGVDLEVFCDAISSDSFYEQLDKLAFFFSSNANT
ncbi:CAP-GLY domain-containing linker protein 3 [Blyttiomyces sp. JEL0837]|nr:CAP-GLY domain-containing linker protein 3 [Blyttiomyces sp. JEL0837]